MIRRDEAEQQVLRLSVLPGMRCIDLPSEITDALELGSRNLEHAGRIVTQAIEVFSASGAVPTSAEILKIAERTDPEFDPREWRCSDCGGTGWKEIFQLHTWTGVNRPTVQEITREQYKKLLPKVSGLTREQLVTPAVEHCHCAAGRKRKEGIAADLLEEALKGHGKRQKTGNGKLQLVS